MRQARPHVVLTEISLPDCLGPEFTRRLKRAFSAINVLAFTAQEDSEIFEAVMGEFNFAELLVTQRGLRDGALVAGAKIGSEPIASVLATGPCVSPFRAR